MVLRRSVTALVSVLTVVSLLAIANPATASAPSMSASALTRTSVPPYPGILQAGSKGPAVVAVQRVLIGLRYLSARSIVLGTFNGATGIAVLRFKRAHPGQGLGSTPRVGPLTYAAITSTSVSATPAPVPAASSSAWRGPTYSGPGDCPTGPDVTTTSAARNSSDARKAVSLHAFLYSPMACKVTWRESNFSCTVVDGSGTYYGKWQLDMQEWPYYGGTKYASTPNRASCEVQNLIAYRNWLDRWWSPWTTAY